MTNRQLFQQNDKEDASKPYLNLKCKQKENKKVEFQIFQKYNFGGEIELENVSAT